MTSRPPCADWITRWRKRAKRRISCANTRLRPADRTATVGIIRNSNKAKRPFPMAEGDAFFRRFQLSGSSIIGMVDSEETLMVEYR